MRAAIIEPDSERQKNHIVHVYVEQLKKIIRDYLKTKYIVLRWWCAFDDTCLLIPKLLKKLINMRVSGPYSRRSVVHTAVYVSITGKL